MDPLTVTERTRVTRLPYRQVHDRVALYEVLDAGLVAHVGVVRDGVPVILPIGYARDGDSLLLHGSTGAGLLREAAAGAPVTVTVTLLDGLVYARSLFDSSMNYRCAMVLGTATPLPDAEKPAALRLLSEHLMPGRWDEVREPTKQELDATLVLSLALDEASAKVRTGPPIDDEEDYELPIWAGVLPLRVSAGEAVPDPRLHEGTPPPSWLEGFDPTHRHES
jgi:nitroimidazol reductase NimA-like FMN-containing flavoprotein (pyridoxamine 5'-phosphate oxidase superfamily)